MIIDGSTLDPTAAYKLLIGSIVPRAIASGFRPRLNGRHLPHRTEYTTMPIDLGPDPAAPHDRRPILD
jgi:hypothetical protein